VNVVSFGSGATTIVGVSGAFGTWEIWQQPFELLSRRHRVIAYDHFGTGETRVPSGLVNFEEQVALLGALLDDRDVDRCVLAGDSNMVAVTVAYALREPARVAGLVLVAGGVAHPRSKLVADFVTGLRTAFDLTIDRFVTFCIPEEDSQHLRDWLRDIIRRTGGERAAELIELFRDVDLSDRLPDLSVPTVIVQGEHDVMPTSTPDNARAMAAAIPGASLELLPGVGHVPTLTRPEEVAAIIERLIARIDVRTAGVAT
jgi:pimeloyl-ACP methyl ester carboxylesterase